MNPRQRVKLYTSVDTINKRASRINFMSNVVRDERQYRGACNLDPKFQDTHIRRQHTIPGQILSIPFRMRLTRDCVALVTKFIAARQTVAVSPIRPV
jgi:hypothetical protein